MKLKSAWIAGLALAIAAGCVIRTEHKIDARIVVDIRHIEETAENVLDFVEGKTDSLPAPAPAADGGTSFLDTAIDFISPIRTVHAEELRQTSPVITELAKKMKERYATLEEMKKKGCVGEDNRGYVALRDCEYCKDAENKNEVQKLIAAENADRKAMYKEIAQLNTEQNVGVSQVERIFAQKRLQRAAAGEIFQLPSQGADLDAFCNSSTGKKLGDECKPDAWVTIK